MSHCKPAITSELLTLVTGPAVSPVALATAKEHLRVDSSAEDTMIQAYIDAATAVAEQRLGKRIITQTVQQSFSRAAQYTELAAVPFQSLSSVSYYDADNATQSGDTADYRATANDDWAYLYTTVTPGTYSRDDAITFEYVVGFGDAPEDVPANIRQAILLLVGQYYAARENAMDVKLTDTPHAFDALIDLSRVGWYG